VNNYGIWTDGSASIVLLPSGSNGDRILELAKEWTQTGLLRPAMWLDLDSVNLFENAPPDVPVKVLGLSPDRELHEIEVDLFGQLAQRELRVVRIVGLRYLTDDKSTHVKQNSLVRDVGHYLERSLPLPVNQTGNSDAKTRLLRLNVVVHPTQLTGIERDQVIEGSWEANLIVSPEDRRSPWTSDAFVRVGSQLDAFALAHIATAAGLWNGLPKGAFDHIATGEGQPGRIVVPRLFVRAVSSDGLARRVSSKALTQFSSAEASTRAGVLSIAIPGTRAIEESRILEYQEWVISSVLSFDGGRLQYPGISATPILPKIKILEIAQLKHFFSFAWNKISQIPKWSWQYVRAGVGARLTQRLQGDEGLATVGIEIDENPDARDRALIERYERIREQVSQVNLAPSVVNLEKVTAESSPELWSGIRKLFFGMLDGSELPANVTPPKYEDERLVFESASSLVFDPENVWTFESAHEDIPGKSVKVANTESARKMQEELDTWLKDSRDVFGSLNQRLAVTKQDIAELQRELAVAKEFDF
jgi:hypothetical protein